MRQKRTSIGITNTTYDKLDYEKAVAYEIRFTEIVYTKSDMEPYSDCCSESSWKFTSVKVNDPKKLTVLKSEWGKRKYAAIDYGGYAVCGEIRDKLVASGLASNEDFTVINNKNGQEVCYQIEPAYSFEGFARDNDLELVDSCESCGLKRYNPGDEPYFLSEDNARKLRGLNCTKELIGPIVEEGIVGVAFSEPIYIVNKETYSFLKNEYPRMHFIPIFPESMKEQLTAEKKRQTDKYHEMVSNLLKKEKHVIDYLPMELPEDANASFCDVEYYLLNSDKNVMLKDRFVAVIYKLMCYYKLCVLWGEWDEYPDPSRVDELFSEIMDNYSGTLYFLFPDINMLIASSWDSLNLEVYNPPKKMRSLLEKVANAEGLFFR